MQVGGLWKFKFIFLCGVALGVPSSLLLAEPLTFSQDVPAAHRQIIQSDLQSLQTRRFLDPSGEILRIFKLSPSSSAANSPPLGKLLETWLKMRLHFIIGPNHPIDSQHVITKAQGLSFPFQQMQQIPKNILSESLQQLTESDSVRSVMSNVGTIIYQTGKELKELYSFQVEGLGWYVVNTPRIGIVQIQESFFSEQVIEAKMPEKSLQFVHSVFRLATLFHEARHSDGRGLSLGFSHVRCPPGHAYENMLACDLPSNGSYRIGALILDSVLQGCTNCSEGERDALKIIRNDNLTRILSAYVPPKDRTEDLSKIKKDLKICELNVFVDQPCDSTQLKKIEWDDQPEVVNWQK